MPWEYSGSWERQTQKSTEFFEPPSYDISYSYIYIYVFKFIGVTAYILYLPHIIHVTKYLLL